MYIYYWKLTSSYIHAPYPTAVFLSPGTKKIKREAFRKIVILPHCLIFNETVANTSLSCIFSWEEHHLTELGIVVLNFALESVLVWCSTKGNLLQTTVLISSSAPLNKIFEKYLWKMLVLVEFITIRSQLFFKNWDLRVVQLF